MTYRGPEGFHSALHNYIARLGQDYDPIVVQTSDEWHFMLQNLAFEYSLAVKTLILPPGVGLSDPRLTKAKTVSARTYYRRPEEFFEYPATCYIADIDAALVPPAESAKPNVETRYQILSDKSMPSSVKAAQVCGKRSMHILQQFETNPPRVTQPGSLGLKPTNPPVYSFFGTQAPTNFPGYTVPGSDRHLQYAA